jgi:hypothetical protein
MRKATWWKDKKEEKHKTSKINPERLCFDDAEMFVVAAFLRHAEAQVLETLD